MVLSEKFDTEGDINQVGKYLIKLHDGIENYLKIQMQNLTWEIVYWKKLFNRFHMTLDILHMCMISY